MDYTFKQQAAIMQGNNAAYLLDKMLPFFSELEQEVIAQARANFRLPQDKRETLEFFMAKLCAIEDLKTTLVQKITVGERYAKENE